MKVILTAFQGKLKSEPMDWPDGSRPEIYMIMDVDKLNVMRTYTEASVFEPEHKKAKFVASGRYFDLGKGETAEEYRLVGLD